MKYFTPENKIKEMILFYGDMASIEKKFKIDKESFTDYKIDEIFNIHLQENMKLVKVKDLFSEKNKDQLLLIETPDGIKRIKNLFIKKEQQILSIWTDNKDKILCSEDHMIETKDGWKLARDLNWDSQILTKDGYAGLDSKVPHSKTKVYDFEIDSDQHRYWAGGISSHNTGKTFLCLNAARKAQEQGYKVIWADTEQAMDDDSFKRFGVKLDELIYLPINTINDLSHYLSNFADVILKAQEEKMDVGKYIVIIDSLGNLSTRKEVNDVNSNSEKKDMTRAGEIKRLFRTCTKKLGGLKIPLIVVNHVYANIGSFIGGTVIGGGQGPFLNSSTILSLTKAQLKEDGKNKTGVIVTSKLDKSRFTKGGIPIKFHISFFKGMNPYVGLENYISWENCGIQSGKILPDGSFQPSETVRSVAVDHLGIHIPKKDLWTSKVFTKEVLEKLDVLIRKDFELPDIESMDYSSEAILDIDDDDIVDNILSDEEETEEKND